MGAIQNTLEKHRWSNLGESFIALGSLLQQEQKNRHKAQARQPE